MNETPLTNEANKKIAESHVWTHMVDEGVVISDVIRGFFNGKRDMLWEFLKMGSPYFIYMFIMVPTIVYFFLG